MSLFAFHNIHVKLRKQAILPRFTDELLKQKDKAGCSELPSEGVAEPAQVQNSLSRLFLLGCVLSVVPPAFLCFCTAPGNCCSPAAAGQPWGFGNATRLGHSGVPANSHPPRRYVLAFMDLLKAVFCCGGSRSCAKEQSTDRWYPVA